MVEERIDKAILELITQGRTVLFLGAGFSLGSLRLRDRKGLKEILLE